MKTRLWQKLFLAFVALSVAALLVFALLQQRAFKRDFLNYVNRISVERLEGVAVQIGQRFGEVGDWSFVERQPRIFERFIDGSNGFVSPNFVPPRDNRRDQRDQREIRLREMNQNDQNQNDEARRGPPSFRDQPAPNPPPNRDERAPPEPTDANQDGRRPPPKKIDPRNIGTRVVLVTKDDQYIIGNPAVPRGAPFIVVKSKGEIVGKLLLAPLPTLQSEADIAFASAQKQHALIASAGVLIGALLLAGLLARWLLAPVKALGAGSKRLAKGDYTARIDVGRGDELGDLARDFNQLAETLQQNQRARREWGADIAHELRTPLTILRGEIQALQDGVRPLDQLALTSLQAECARLTSLVEDLYQLALSDAGALEYKFLSLDVRQFIQDAVDEHTSKLARAGLTLSLAPLPAKPCIINADESRLTQLISNLLTNATRYTDAPGAVKIELIGNDIGCQIHIDDTPPGVPAALMPKLFERLFRVESSRTRAAGGAGLGLSICKNIAEAHGGKIEASSSALGGLRITVTLPRAKALVPAQPREQTRDLP